MLFHLLIILRSAAKIMINWIYIALIPKNIRLIHIVKSEIIFPLSFLYNIYTKQIENTNYPNIINPLSLHSIDILNKLPSGHLPYHKSGRL